MELCARRYDTSQTVRLEIAGQVIARAVHVPEEPGQGRDWPWVAPGLVDIQVNGYGGQEFSSPELSVEKVARIAADLGSQGATGFCPTVTTQSFEILEHALRTLAAAFDSHEPWARRMLGIHLEGPYITAQDGARGAHPRAFCRPPDWDEFQRLQAAAAGHIRILTMSPEYPNSPAFIERVAATGVVVSLGHTSAEPDQIRAAADAGARWSTHLGNGSHAMLPRHRNYVWAQLAEDRLWAGLIVDGRHLPPDVVKTFVRAKQIERCVLVSDMSGLAGLPPGRYSTTLSDVEILPDGSLVVAGQRELLAGAGLPLSVGIGNVMHFAGIGLADAVRMATLHPARLIGAPAGNLQPGDPADLVVFDLFQPAGNAAPRFTVREVIAGGQMLSHK